MDFNYASEVMNRLIAFVIALITNEIAQGYMAKHQGDNTPELNGRLTLNPIPHMDPLGSVLFPLIGIMMGGFIFGWPKPMPIDTRNMKNPKWGPVLTALAGPLANLLLCSISVAAIYAMGNVQDGTPMIAIYRIFKEMMLICSIWAFFQLIPLPPLAGSEIVSALLPHDLRVKYESLAQYSFFIFLALIFTGAFRILIVFAQGWIILSEWLIFTIINS